MYISRNQRGQHYIKEIAQQMGIGYRTVHQHAGSIYVKLGVRGRQGLMARWLRHRAPAAG